MPGLEVFSTADQAPRDRVAYWSDGVWGRIGGIETRTPEGATLDARLVSGSVGPVQVCRIGVGPHHIARPRRLVRREGSQWLKVVFQTKGRMDLEQNGREVALQRGQWCVYDMGAPYAIRNDGPLEQVALLIRRDQVPSSIFDLSAQLLRASDWRSGVGNILFRAICSTFRQLDSISPNVENELGDSLLSLSQLALVEKLNLTVPAGGRDAARRRIADYVERNLRSPELSIDDIARALNCTKRYLHKVFNEGGRTLNTYIWERRLERCERDLIRPELAGESITQISFSWGFSNSAHFSRVFKEKYGMTPRDWRKAHALRAAAA